MEKQFITDPEQKCLSRCIYKYWSENSKIDPTHRQEKYERCLSDCQICS